MNLVELIIMAMFDIVEYIIISKKLVYGYKVDNYKVSKLLVVISILGFSLVMGVFSILSASKYNIIISAPLSIGISFLLYRRKIKETIYLYVISIIIILSIQFTGITLIKIAGISVGYNFTSGLAVHIIAMILIAVINKYLPINTISNYVKKDNKTFKFLLLNMLIILISILLYWYVDISGMLQNLISIAVLSTGIILINFVLLKNGLKNELEEKQLKIYEDYLPVIDELISELRKKQHEFDNHIQALNMLTIISKDYESIVESMKVYIKDLEDSNDLKDLIKINNKILAGFLYNKMKNAEKLNIQFDIIIKDYQTKFELKDYELVEIMGNLINNAFETGVENNSVVLILSKEKDMNVIEIRNKHPYLNKESIDKIFNKGFSTKSHIGRGYGLYNIKEIVEKYNGKIEILNKLYNNENYIFFRILFIRN